MKSYEAQFLQCEKLKKVVYKMCMEYFRVFLRNGLLERKDAEWNEPRYKLKLNIWMCYIENFAR